MAKGIEQYAPHVPFVNGARRPVLRVQHRQQSQMRVMLEMVHRLTEWLAQPDGRGGRDQVQSACHPITGRIVIQVVRRRSLVHERRLAWNW